MVAAPDVDTLDKLDRALLAELGWHLRDGALHREPLAE